MASLEEFREVVIALSTVQWLDGSRPADPWIIDYVPLGERRLRSRDHYVRLGKFSSNVTKPQYDRLYPTPYTSPVSHFPRYGTESLMTFVESELKKPQEMSFRTAFYHFYRARFETPFFTSPADDLESLWAGFESLVELPRSTAPVERWEALVDALKKELPFPALRPEFWAGVAEWSKKTYEARVTESHGLRRTLPDLRLEDYDENVFSVGVQLAEAILKIRAFNSNFMIIESTVDRLNQVFLEVPVILRVIQSIRTTKAPDWYPGSSAQSPVTQKFRTALRDAILFQELHHQYESTKGLAHVRKTVNLVLSAWASALATAPPKNGSAKPVLQLPAWIASAASPSAKPDEVHESVIQRLIASGAHEPNAYGDLSAGIPRELKLQDAIPIWELVRLYIRLEEAHRGYRIL